jgi:chorismate mutase
MLLVAPVTDPAQVEGLVRAGATGVWCEGAPAPKLAVACRERGVELLVRLRPGAHLPADLPEGVTGILLGQAEQLADLAPLPAGMPCLVEVSSGLAYREGWRCALPVLEAVRRQIDELHLELGDLLRRRGELAIQAAHAKRHLSLPVRDEEREEQMLAAFRGLDVSPLGSESLERVLRALLRETRALVEAELAGDRPDHLPGERER